MTTFDALGLAEPLLRALAAEGYAAPTPIQTEAIPSALAGRDLMGLAATGTGKTAAFLLPLLHRLALEGGKRPVPGTCRALVLAPTRELAAQIHEAAGRLGRFTGLTARIVIGGVKPGPEARALAGGTDLLVATPGRLEDHVRSGALRLGRTTVVVLDEADRMLDLGFLPAMRRILSALPDGRQTLLLSATMPADIRRLADDLMRDPVEVAVSPVTRPIERIEQRIVSVAPGPAARREALVRLLGAPEVTRAIVFTRTKRGADRVDAHLRKAGVAASAIHGDKSQGQRTRALDAFRSGAAPVLVATDIAARGIDVTGVSHVVNFDLPDTAEAYVHRVGRTGRAGADGVAITFSDGTEGAMLKAVERFASRAGEGGTAFPAEGAARAPDGGAPGGAGRRRGGAKTTRSPETGAGARQGSATKGAGRAGPASRSDTHADPRGRRKGRAAPRAGEDGQAGLHRMLGVAHDETSRRRRPRPSPARVEETLAAPRSGAGATLDRQERSK